MPVCASTLAAPSSALAVLSAVIQSPIAPRRVWTVIPWVVSADGEMLAESSKCEGGGKVPIEKSELKSQRADLRLQLQRCSGSAEAQAGLVLSEDAAR